MERGGRRMVVTALLGVVLSWIWGLTGWAENDTAENIQGHTDSWHQESQGLHGVSEEIWQEPSAFQSSTAGAETSHDAGAQMGNMRQGPSMTAPSSLTGVSGAWGLERSVESSHEASQGSHGFGEETQRSGQAFQSPTGGTEMLHDSWTQGGRDGMGENAQGWQSLQMPTSGFGMPKELSSQSQTVATEPAKDMTEQLQRLGVMSEKGGQTDRVGSQHQATIPSDVQEMLKSQQAAQPTMMRGAEPSGSSMSGTWTHTAPQEQRNLMGANNLMGNQRDVSAGAHEMGRNGGGSSPSAPSGPISLSGQGVVEIHQDSGPGGGRGGSGGEGRHH